MKLKVKKLGPFGLMFRPKPKIPVLVALDGHGIHTWFVFYPIRAVFLDVNCVIIAIRWYIEPFSVFKPHTPPAFVIESDVDDPWCPALGGKVELEVV